MKPLITWYMDGNQFHKVTGSRLGSPNVWAALTQSSLYIIFNAPVGGDWVGKHKLDRISSS